MSWELIDQATRNIFHSLAGNYPGTYGQQLYTQLVDRYPEATGHDQVIIDFIKGNEKLGIEPRHIMHGVSDANDGASTIDNLRFGPESINSRMSANNMTPADEVFIDMHNQSSMDTLLEHYGPAEEAADTIVSVTETFDYIPGAASTVPEVVEIADTAVSTTELTTTAVEAGSESLAESVGELIIDGLMPTVVGIKVAHEVVKRCDTTKDKIGYGSLFGGGSVALACTPPGQAAIGLYCGYKLIRFGFKAAKWVNQRNTRTLA